jgi:hypothetical protein
MCNTQDTKNIYYKFVITQDIKNCKKKNKW